MILTGKCKEEFEKWYSESVEFIGEVLYLEEFYILPQSMQYGVYVDFFKQVANLDVYYKPYNRDQYSVYVDCEGSHILTNYVMPTGLDNTFTAAIEKANEIYNQ